MIAVEQLVTDDDGISALIAKLQVRDEISAEEEAVLRALPDEVVDLRAGKVIVREGALLNVSTLLVDGFVCRYKDLAGGERQIQEMHVRGDFVDLHGFILKRVDHNVAALSPGRVAFVPHSRLKKVTEGYPHLTRLLWFSTMLDAAIQRETILSIGRRPAVARIAHLMCELCLRLEVVDRSRNRRFDLPIRQNDIADATGLTPVHVNRMLRKLRDQGLLTFRSGEAVIHDWEGLASVAEFDPDYLHLERLPH